MEALANVRAAIPSIRQLAGVGVSYNDCEEIRDALGDMLALQVRPAMQHYPHRAEGLWNVNIVIDIVKSKGLSARPEGLPPACLRKSVFDASRKIPLTCAC